MEIFSLNISMLVLLDNGMVIKFISHAIFAICKRAFKCRFEYLNFIWNSLNTLVLVLVAFLHFTSHEMCIVPLTFIYAMVSNVSIKLNTNREWNEKNSEVEFRLALSIESQFIIASCTKKTTLSSFRYVWNARCNQKSLFRRKMKWTWALSMNSVHSTLSNCFPNHIEKKISCDE